MTIGEFDAGFIFGVFNTLLFVGLGIALYFDWRHRRSKP